MFKCLLSVCVKGVCVWVFLIVMVFMLLGKLGLFCKWKL